MNNGLAESDMQIIIEIIEKFVEVECAIIYGSRGTGNYQKGSDIDIALKGNKVTNDICSKIHYKLEEETILPYFFDVTNYESIINMKIKEQIDRFGKVFYKKS